MNVYVVGGIIIAAMFAMFAMAIDWAYVKAWVKSKLKK